MDLGRLLRGKASQVGDHPCNSANSERRSSGPGRRYSSLPHLLTATLSPFGSPLLDHFGHGPIRLTFHFEVLWATELHVTQKHPTACT